MNGTSTRCSTKRAASLPDSPLSLPNAASGATALGTSTSAHPSSTPTSGRTVPFGAAALVGLAVVAAIGSAIAVGRTGDAPRSEPSHGAAMPIADVKPRAPAAVASEGPTPPPLRIEDLPAVERGGVRVSAQPSSRATTGSPLPAAIPRATASAVGPRPPPIQRPSPASRPMADPVRGKRVTLIFRNLVASVFVVAVALCGASTAHAQSAAAAA